MNNQTKIDMLEDAVFPAEFISCFVETAFRALFDYLERTDAPKDAVMLLDSVQVLMSESSDMTRTGGKVRRDVNRALIDNVTDASRCIVSLGGVFYCPSGTTVPREDKQREPQ